MPTPAEAADVLLTVRDCLRYAVSRFNAAGLVYGHGTTNAFDEAAFVVLEGLHLPVDQLEPYLDARLLPAERLKLAEIVEARVTTRKPAAYLLGRTYIQGIPFRVDERVIVPRSFIGELLLSETFRQGDDMFVPDPSAIESVLELCTGSGCLAIIASMVFEAAEVDAVDLSADALAVARLNVDESGHADRIRLLHGDLYGPVAGRLYDLIVTNPPYVDAQAMSLLPPEYRHEPTMALDGGEDGLDLVRRIIDGAAAHLVPGGGLLCEIGTGREALEEAYPDLPFLWLDTAESEAEVFWITARDLRAA